jgi:DNA recombination protein RmuC
MSIEATMFLLGFLLGSGISLAVLWILLSQKNRSAMRVLDKLRSENSQLAVETACLKTEGEKNIEFFNKRLADLSSTHDKMKEAFAAISRDALIKNADMLNTSFKQSLDHFFKTSERDRLMSNESLAHIINPLKESLVSVDKKVQELEANRQGAYTGLREQIEGLLKSQASLQKDTQNLARALNSPIIRGRWGEMQLRRVVELSGLSAHCDFVEQKSIKDGDETLRPDMIVTMPKNKKIVIDAKVPLELFGVDEGPSSKESKEESRGQDLAVSLRRHLSSLKKKSYHSVLGDSPEFVVMFLPGEAFLHRALAADPSLLDYAAQREVIIATPITLIALLKAIAFGFNQVSVANNIEEVRRLSQQLIDRVSNVSLHFEKLGKSLKQANEAYNQTLSSLDSRVLVTARKLAEIKSLATDAKDLVKEDLPFLE